MLWAVWRERNQRLWSQVSSSARTVVSGGQEAVSEWRTVRAVTRGGVGGIGNQQQVCAKWHSPTQPWLKCNVDAGFKPNERKWGCGMILRSSDGAVVSCRTSWRIGKPEVREGEALALLDALLWIEQSGYEQVIFEVDSAEVESATRREGRESTEFGMIISDCKDVLVSRQDFRVVVVRRDRNKAAHELAQQSYTFASPSVWHASPSWLVHALHPMCMDTLH
ncbi:hypothetical protein LINPERHAP1_LOCUS41395 [Linum perenne]